MLLYFIYLLLNSTFSQEWIPYYEDDKISISYTSKVCDDRQNGFDFEYYLIRVTSNVAVNLSSEYCPCKLDENHTSSDRKCKTIPAASA